MRRCRGKLAALAVLLLCAACAGGPKPLDAAPSWAQTEGVRYVCANKKTFVVTFSPDGSKAAIKLNDALYEASRDRSGSGVRYTSTDIDFSGKGRIGQLAKSPDGSYPDCKVID